MSDYVIGFAMAILACYLIAQSAIGVARINFTLIGYQCSLDTNEHSNEWKCEATE